MQSVAKKTLTTLSVLPFHGENASLYVKTAKPHKGEGGGEFEVTITSAPISNRGIVTVEMVWDGILDGGAGRTLVGIANNL